MKDEVRLVSDPIDPSHLVNIVRDPSAGAIATFLGTTRDNFENKKVISLEYEAYPEMAILEMGKICEKIRKDWNVLHIAIFHRTGSCPIGEVSVMIAISSAHRRESLAATDFAINELKRTVPIWKKEMYDDSEGIWKKNLDIEVTEPV